LNSSNDKFIGKGGYGADDLKFFTEDATGLKIHPKTVLGK
jgi:hypothetical protein